MIKRKALLIDFTKCIGCQACVYACKESNKLPDPEKEEEELSPSAYTVVKEKEDVYYRRLCMHCNDPTCASVCPVKAFEPLMNGKAPSLWSPSAPCAQKDRSRER